jgi:hypothetical protein
MAWKPSNSCGTSTRTDCLAAYSDYSWEAMAERLEFGDQLLILKKPFDSLEIRQMANALTWKWQLAQDAALKCSAWSAPSRNACTNWVSHLLQYDASPNCPTAPCWAIADPGHRRLPAP